MNSHALWLWPPVSPDPYWGPDGTLERRPPPESEPLWILTHGTWTKCKEKQAAASSMYQSVSLTVMIYIHLHIKSDVVNSNSFS
jgi:hypothetical protein